MLPDRQKARLAVTNGASGRALTDAVFEGDDAAVRRMLRADPALRDTHVPPVPYPDLAPDGQIGDLPGFAVARGDGEMLALLLAAGVPPDGAVPGFALDLAVNMNRLDLAQILLKAGARANPEAAGATHIPLLSAGRRANIEAARLLMAHGADPDWRDSADTSLLQTIVDMDSMRVAEVLIEGGGDPWAYNSGGTVPARGIYEPLKLTSPEEEGARQRLLAKIRRPDRPWPPPLPSKAAVRH